MSIHYYQRENAGSSVSFEKSIHKTIYSSLLKGMYSIQFFLGSYISINRSKIEDNDFKISNDLLKRYKMNIFTHLPYVHNLCGKGGYLYDECETAKNHVEICVKSIANEINIISRVIQNTKSKGGCVLHIGSIGSDIKDKDKINKKKNQALDIVIESINKITTQLEPGKANLLLETMVGRGGVIGSSFEELKYIYDNLNDKDRVGICIDTCHIHAQGLYKLSSINDIDKLFEDFKTFFSIEQLQLVHLNDSCFEFNCKKDRHQSLLKGTIWKKKQLYYFIDKLEQLNIPYVLETTEDDYPLLQYINLPDDINL